jgi:hypothetical protein
MTKKITKVTSTLEGEETKSNKSLHTQQSKTQTDVQAILTEQEKREVQYFLSKME